MLVLWIFCIYLDLLLLFLSILLELLSYCMALPTCQHTWAFNIFLTKPSEYQALVELAISHSAQLSG